MPVPLRTTYHKAEAKYNVTTEFPSLGLHSAAATGNVGLVEYALDHGQPVNSVLDGVLPLHAACAGGNVQVVKVLIDHGADVNAPRLPRKYSTDKNRDTSVPIVGTSGSTPLHFAAANGNTAVVNLLLHHGAHADRPDKHSVTPAMLAEQNGWIECAKLLKDWVLNKDRDLREREGLDSKMVPSSSGPSTHNDQSTPSEVIPASPSTRRRLHVKQSIDTALNMLKSTDPLAKTSHSVHTSTPPPSPLRPFGEYTFHPIQESQFFDPGPRRPSLPQVLHPPSPEIPRKKYISHSTSSTPRQRRPRSAGTGGEEEQEEVMHPVYGRGGSGRKLGSKYSLLNLFKKGQSHDSSESGLNLSEGSVRSEGYATSSGPASTTTLPLAIPSSRSKHGDEVDLTETNALSTSATSHSPRPGFRFHRGSDASTRGGRVYPSQSPAPSTQSLPRKPSGNLQTSLQGSAPLAVELHLALAHQHQNRGKPPPLPLSGPPMEEEEKPKPSSPLVRLMHLPNHHRNRSGSSGTPPVDLHSPEQVFSQSPSNMEFELDKPSSNPRPGILRAHNRTPSSGQGGSPLPSRTLRFDSSSSVPPERKPRSRESPRPSPVPLKSQSSANSLTKLRIQTNSNDDVQSPVRATYALDEAEDDNENYGQTLGSSELPTSRSLLLQRQRGLSFASSSDSSLSPILSGDNLNNQTINADFPFSINQRPSQDNTERLQVPVSSDLRNRGDSLSSESTSDSRNLATMTSSSTSQNGTVTTISTPGIDNILVLPPDGEKGDPTKVADDAIDEERGLTIVPRTSGQGLQERRTHSPLDIDIFSISSHAQAEALVERAKQEALDLASEQDFSPESFGTGRSPLSARLAAYGESLALERKLREQKELENKPISESGIRSSSPEYPAPPTLGFPPRRNREGVERQLSLENKSTSPRSKSKKPKDPRRPSTAEGLSSREPSSSFFAARSPSHASSLSTSTTNQAANSPQDSLLIPNDTERDLPDIPVPYLTLNATNTNRSQPQEVPLSRISSIDGGDTETDTVQTLHRSTTAPLSLAKDKRELSRNKKLTKMGYPITEQSAASAATRPQPSQTPPSNKRFGLRTIIQTFKGKP